MLEVLPSNFYLKVASIECPERNPLKIDAWIESMRDLHRSKPPSSVTYSTPMPDIEQLLEVEVKMLVSQCHLELQPYYLRFECNGRMCA